MKRRGYRLYGKHRNLKALAHSKLQAAVRRGEVSVPTTCSKCGKEGDVEGHHEDYSKPLEVDWLCGSCHKKVHLAPLPRGRTTTITVDYGVWDRFRVAAIKCGYKYGDAANMALEEWICSVSAIQLENSEGSLKA